MVGDRTGGLDVHFRQEPEAAIVVRVTQDINGCHPLPVQLSKTCVHELGAKARALTVRRDGERSEQSGCCIVLGMRENHVADRAIGDALYQAEHSIRQIEQFTYERPKVFIGKRIRVKALQRFLVARSRG